VNPSGSILRRNIRSFKVDSRTHLPEKGIVLDSIRYDFQLADHPLIGGSDEGGKKASDTRGSQGAACLMESFRGKTRAIEIHTPKSVHLGIKKP
jgi:hypothetical protein